MPQANRSALISMATCSGGSFSAPADDQRHRDGAGIHHQHMLQAEDQQARIRQTFVHRVKGLVHGSPLIDRPSRQGRADRVASLSYKGRARTGRGEAG